MNETNIPPSTLPFVSRLISFSFPTLPNFFHSFICVKISHAHLDIHHLFWHPSFPSSCFFFFSPYYFLVVVVVFVTNLMWWRWAKKGTECTVSISLRWIVLENNLKLLCLALCLVFSVATCLDLLVLGNWLKIIKKMIQVLNYKTEIWWCRFNTFYTSDYL